MISSQDVDNFLKKMDKLETDMQNYYNELSKKVSDKWLKDAFTRLSEEEREHSGDVHEIINLLKKSVK